MEFRHFQLSLAAIQKFPIIFFDGNFHISKIFDKWVFLFFPINHAFLCSELKKVSCT